MAQSLDQLNARIAELETENKALFDVVSGIGPTISEATQALRGFSLSAQGSATACAELLAQAGGLPPGGDGGTLPSFIAKLKSAATAAPSSIAAIPRSAPAISYGGQNAPPYALGAYTRHWIAGAGSGGAADLKTVTKAQVAGNIGPWLNGTQRAARFSCQDGSSAAWNTSDSPFPDGNGNTAGMYFGFKYSGRRFAFSVREFCYGTILVDGADSQFWKPSADSYVIVDFGSAGSRNIVIQGKSDTWLADVCVETGATMEPYDFMAGKLSVAHMGDSYSTSTYDPLNYDFHRLLAELVGGGHYYGSSYGGTGYSKELGGLPSANDARRLNVIPSGSPDVIFVMLGINDGWPTQAHTDNVIVNTAAEMLATYQKLRTANPTSLIVAVTPWAPKQSDGANLQGNFRAKRQALIDILAQISGPWIFLDGLLGEWRTSKGTTSQVSTGAWIKGDGYVGNTTGTGNADTWIGPDGTHPTQGAGGGVEGLIQSCVVPAYKAALASM